MMRQFQTYACGDAVTDAPIEECDDGTMGPDGCNAACEIEEAFQLSGVAQGDGQVSLTIEGELIVVVTTNGQTAADVIAALVAEINANATLQAAGVTAEADGERLVTNGDITDASITDSGLTDVLEMKVERKHLWWTTVGGATDYDVVTGDIFGLQTAGTFNDPAATTGCVRNNFVPTYIEASASPSAGDGWWYLVRDNPGGNYDTGGAGQAGPRDTDIGNSGNGCP